MTAENRTLTAIPGLRVGHWTNLEGGTGCTVVLCPQGAVAGVDVRGGAPGTRETQLLSPTCAIEHVHAVLIGGGSAYGLAAADGVMRWLEERSHGFDVGIAKVPIVPAAILFDLPVLRADQPTARRRSRLRSLRSGDRCAGNTGQHRRRHWRNVWQGAGLRPSHEGWPWLSRDRTGQRLDRRCTCGGQRLRRRDRSAHWPHPGWRTPARRTWLCRHHGLPARSRPALPGTVGRATTRPEHHLAVVATNAALTKAQATKVAQMAHNGLARTIRPIHTMLDGNTIFALSLGSLRADVSLLGELAAEVVAQAVVNAVMAADPLGDLPCARDFLS
jgi:L-aminopeptidase/D-esterase-like protein